MLLEVQQVVTLILQRLMKRKLNSGLFGGDIERNLGIDTDNWCGNFGWKNYSTIENKQSPFWRYNTPGKQVFLVDTISMNKMRIFMLKK